MDGGLAKGQVGEGKGSFLLPPVSCHKLLSLLVVAAAIFWHFQLAMTSHPAASAAPAAVQHPSGRSRNVEMHLHLLALQIQLGEVLHQPGAFQILAVAPLVLLPNCRQEKNVCQ